MKYRPEVDGLRALAVLPVVAFHAGAPMLRGGYAGVDVFFVISGYLITTILVTELERGRFSILDFYERRARRILPALFFVLLVCLPLAWRLLLPHDYKSFSQSLVAVALFASNILFWKTSGYFDVRAELKPLLHTWSLAVEEQYYVFFPPLLALAWRLGRRRVVALIGAVLLLSLAVAQREATHAPMAAFFLPHTRAWELLVGSFVAFAYPSAVVQGLSRPIRNVASALGVLLLVGGYVAFDAKTPFPGVHALAPTLGTALVILTARSDTHVGKLLSLAPLVRVGLLSFSAYLWHQPLLAFARHQAGGSLDIVTTCALVALTFVLAYLTWRFVETPFRRRERFGRRAIFTGALAGSLAVAGVGIAGQVREGFESRFVAAYPGDVGETEFFRVAQERYVRCEPEPLARAAEEWKGVVRCFQSKRDRPVDVAILGDSHAEHLFLGFADTLKEANVAYYARNAPPLVDNPRFSDVFEHLRTTKTISRVLVTMNWANRLQELPPGTTLEEGMVRTVRALVEAGKDVYVVDDTPRFPHGGETCKYRAGETGVRFCEMSTSDAVAQEALTSPALARAVARVPGAHLVLLRDLFCDEARCSMVRDGTLMFRDDNHVNVPGSRYVATRVGAAFPALAR